MVDVPFVTWAFPIPAVGAVPRTMPDRLAEVKNLKDFGAIGTGVDDTAAFNNALGWTAGPNRGIIDIPPGFYTINSPLLLNYDPAPGQPGLSIHLRGSNTGSTFLNFPGAPKYGIDRSLVTPNNTARVIVENINMNAGIRLGSCSKIMLQDLELPYISTEDSPGNSSQNISIRSCQINGGGIVMGGSGIIQGCDFVSCEIAARMYGRGWAISGGRCEESNLYLMIGLDTGVDATFTGTVSHTGTNDDSGVLTVSSVASGTIKPWRQLAGAGVPKAIFIVSQISGTPGGAGTYHITNPTFTISTPQSFNAIGIDRGAAGFALFGGSSEGNWNGAIYGGTCSGFYHGAMGFLGHFNSGPLTDLPTQYHLIVGPNCSSGKFQGLYGLGDLADIAGGRVDTASARANLLFATCTLSKGVSGAPGAVDWILPTNAYTAQWNLCNVSPVWTFTQLPSGGNVLQGDQFTISDPNTNTWGANVTASGASGQVLVRWNGSNWTVVGK